MTCAIVPSFTAFWNRLLNIRNNETPRMISGTTNEKSMMKLDPAAGRPRQRSMPIANAVPSGTASTTVRNESLNVWNIAVRSVGSCQSESNGSWYHHRIEKPCQVLRDRPALNEKITAMITGTIDQNRYPHVIAWRNRGLRHGLLSHPPLACVTTVTVERGHHGRGVGRYLAHVRPSAARFVARR